MSVDSLPSFIISIQSENSPSSSGRIESFDAMNSEIAGPASSLTAEKKRIIGSKMEGRNMGLNTGGVY